MAGVAENLNAHDSSFDQHRPRTDEDHMQIDDKYDNDDGDSKAKNVRKTVKGLETGGNTLHKLNDGNVFSNGSSGRGGAHVHIVDAK